MGILAVHSNSDFFSFHFDIIMISSIYRLTIWSEISPRKYLIMNMTVKS